MGKKEMFYADIMAMHPQVTGSLLFVVVKMPDHESIRFIVDCGLFQERDYSELNRTLPFDPEKLDFCLITHNHVDHTGRLPLLVRNGFYNGIYTTEATGMLLPLALADSHKVLRDVSKRNHQKCLYEEQDVSKTLSLLRTCKFNEPIAVHPNVKVTFLKNGHLVGSAMILVQISYPEFEDINILFTGDYNNKNMFFDVDPVPEWVLNLPLTIIQESTYGYMNSDEIKPCFRQNILECLEKGGSVITPVFSLGRSQEILYTLKVMQEDGSLEKDIPIFFDGKLALRYTSLYLQKDLGLKEEMKDFLPENLTFVDKLIRPDVLYSSGPKIVVTTSGMGSYGPAHTYIPEYIRRKGDLIHFTGYTSEGTLGYRLKETKFGDTVEVGGLVLRKAAQVKYTTEFSAHAKADEMIDFLKQFKNIKLVLVNHGQTEVKADFAKRIVNEIDPKNVGILGRDYFFRINPYGLIKTLSTKFE